VADVLIRYYPRSEVFSIGGLTCTRQYLEEQPADLVDKMFGKENVDKCREILKDLGKTAISKKGRGKRVKL
jgi:hypothetical protein